MGYTPIYHVSPVCGCVWVCAPFLLSAQAIRDGVIEAGLDHEMSFMQSRENVDVYSTKEPHDAFHQRIMFCLDLYGQSVKVSLEGRD